MLSCKDVTEQTSDYLDKSMPLFKRVQYRLHLMMCHGCRHFVDQFKITVESIKGLGPDAVSDESIDKQVEELLKHTKK